MILTGVRYALDKHLFQTNLDDINKIRNINVALFHHHGVHVLVVAGGGIPETIREHKHQSAVPLERRLESYCGDRGKSMHHWRKIVTRNEIPRGSSMKPLNYNVRTVERHCINNTCKGGPWKDSRKADAEPVLWPKTMRVVLLSVGPGSDSA